MYGIRTDASFVADARTVAYARTSKGHHLRVSLGRAPPPASSFVYYDFPDTAPGVEEEDDDVDERDKDDGVDDDDECDEDDDDDECEMSNQRCPYGFEDEHFLYRAGAAAGSPSMSLLPDRDFPRQSEQVCEPYMSPPIRPIVHSGTTALLRRGDGDVLLVQLHCKYDRDARRDTAEFCLLRRGAPRWELKEPVPIVVHDDGGSKGGVEQLRGRCTNTIVPVGDRFLCWVKYESGFLLCDMADDALPKVRYTPLPAGVIWDPKNYGDDKDDRRRRPSTPRAWAPPAPARRGSAWSTDLAMDEPPAWVEDGEIACEELWALPGYEGLPRANLQCPVVCLDDPDAVCFLVSNAHFVSSYKERKTWMVQLNIKNKTLLSVAEFTADPWQAYSHSPAKLMC
ncbi:LOW QUALITY PROTEIN: hypothetical protein PAHAL_8G055000 [Panicum hallii]|uniref:DUF1618 domain-containing protein n=1 Tax=Panicum hallii TaxID=206008 RepID=A0A2T8I7T2_9POAL|nr:LOW QUALITY PROTEIN: hypothetical protein PAHAL_8G055000 [Panicum hallii]